MTVACEESEKAKPALLVDGAGAGGPAASGSGGVGPGYPLDGRELCDENREKRLAESPESGNERLWSAD